MKTMRIIRFVKKTCCVPVACWLSAQICISCSDEDGGRYSRGHSIGFAVAPLPESGEGDGGEREPAAEGKAGKSAAPDTLPAVRLFALEGGLSPEGKRLFLQALVADGMENREGGDESGPSLTRGLPLDPSMMHEEAGVFASIYPSTGTWDGTVPPNYIYDAKIKKTDSWTTSYNWPGAAYRVGFFAYAPYRGAGMDFSPATSPGAPVLTYDVPADVLLQPDLLTSHEVDVPGNRNSAVPLRFRHALTAVRFETGSRLLPGTLTRITLRGVYGKASYRLGEDAWSAHTNTRNFVQSMNVSTPDPESPGTPLTSPAATFMMLPQTLPAGARIEVEYTDNLTNTPRTLTAGIAGSLWPMGKTVTYRISTGSITVTPMLNVIAPADFEHTGGTQAYTVTSYLDVRRPGDPPKAVPMAWTVEYSTDNGLSWSNTKPAWLTTFTESGPGGNTPATHQVTAAAQAKVVHEPNNDNLRAAAPKTNWNLSNATGADAVQNTANCYVVNAPGTYRLPLVYGNAIKNGSTNASAYTSTASGTNVLTPFINHLGNAITNPYIGSNAGCTPANATLVWQDEQDLVTGVGLSGNFLTFTVNQATIKQGNAVVAVRDASNTILWSWHIWVTDYVLGTNLKTITNFQHNPYTILPVNLGWCDERRENYAGREVKVRFKQQATAGYAGTTETVTMKQKAKEIIYTGNNTYYQWGRKDPFVGALENPDGSLNSINKTWYDVSGATHTDEHPATSSFPYEDVCITSGITRPNTFCTNGYMDYKYANLWSADNNVYTANDNPVVKTIYDPCPAGYKMPPSNVYTGFTTTGEGTSNSSEFNVQGPWNKGWNFHCGLNHTGSTVFFPASGYRYYTSAVPYNVGGSAYYWTAGPNYTYYGRSLNFYPGYVYPLSNYSRSLGFGVRAAQEE